MSTQRGTAGDRSLHIRRGLAAASALTLAAWGALALPAAADPGNGNGNANGNAATPGPQNGSDNADAPKDKGDKGDKGNGNGPKGDNGNNGHGPKANNGHDGDHHGHGPKANHGNHGNQADQADQGQDQGQDPKGNNGQGDGIVDPVGNPGGSNGDPAGNNGTVKITPHLEDDGIPQNTPHVSCVFDIEWYGFDEGADIVSTVVFAVQAPTSDVGLSGTEPSQVFVGGDPASGAGTDSGFDGEATYTLAFAGEPHPQQGYHVKLTVHTPGSQGADTKHKVFWVQPCGGTPPVLLSQPGGTEEVEVPVVEVPDQQQLVDSAADFVDADAGVMGIQATAADEVDLLDFQMMAVEAVQMDVPNAVAAGGAGSPLDATVDPTLASALPLLVLTLGLALGGAALVSRRRVLIR